MAEEINQQQCCLDLLSQMEAAGGHKLVKDFIDIGKYTLNQWIKENQARAEEQSKLACRNCPATQKKSMADEYSTS